MIWNKQIKLQLKMTYIGEYNSPIRNVCGESEEDMGHCPSCENPDAISLCFAYFSSLVAAASSWHYILRLPGPAREKASFPTIVCWAWTNQVSDWMLGVDWLIPKTHTTSLSVVVLRRVVQTVWFMSNRACLSVDWLVSLPHLIVKEEWGEGGEPQCTGECWLACKY